MDNKESEHLILCEFYGW